MMNHPFIGDLSEKTMEELQETISNLTSKLTFASRSGRYDMVNQINMAIGNYKQEYQKRQQELWDKSFKKKDSPVKVD
jgi:hypothetical protein